MTLYLCHESCEENGATIEVGGGWAGKIRFQSSEGALFATKAKETFKIYASFEAQSLALESTL